MGKDKILAHTLFLQVKITLILYKGFWEGSGEVFLQKDLPSVPLSQIPFPRVGEDGHDPLAGVFGAGGCHGGGMEGGTA